MNASEVMCDMQRAMERKGAEHEVVLVHAVVHGRDELLVLQVHGVHVAVPPMCNVIISATEVGTP